MTENLKISGYRFVGSPAYDCRSEEVLRYEPAILCSPSFENN